MPLDSLDTLIQNELSDQHGPCDVLPAEYAGIDPRAGALFVGGDYIATTRPGLLEHYSELTSHPAREEHDSYVIYLGDPDDMYCPVMYLIGRATLYPELMAA